MKRTWESAIQPMDGLLIGIHMYYIHIQPVWTLSIFKNAEENNNSQSNDLSLGTFHLIPVPSNLITCVFEAIVFLKIDQNFVILNFLQNLSKLL
jgi:hypothetical protein